MSAQSTTTFGTSTAHWEIKNHESKSVQGSSNEGATDTEKCNNAVKNGMIEAKPWMGCRPVSGTKRFFTFLGVRNCQIQIKCDIQPEEALQLKDMATGLRAACHAAEKETHNEYQKDILKKEKEYARLRKIIDIKVKRKKDDPLYEASLRVKKKQIKLRKMQFAIRQMNSIMKNFREWNIFALKEFSADKMNPTYLFEAMKYKIPVAKDKEGNIQTQSQLVEEDCTAAQNKDCTYTVSTTQPYRRVIELRVSQTQPKVASITVCYGDTKINSKNAECVERTESLKSTQLSSQEYLYDAEYYAARSEWSSPQDYAHNKGKNIDCGMLSKLENRISFPAESIASSLEDKPEIFKRKIPYRIERGGVMEKMGY